MKIAENSPCRVQLALMLLREAFKTGRGRVMHEGFKLLRGSQRTTRVIWSQASTLHGHVLLARREKECQVRWRVVRETKG
jgi:hypothetical protein